MATTTFFQLLDLNPWREEKLEEEKFMAMVQADPTIVKRKYQFDAFGDDWVFPLHQICALGATAHCVKACFKGYPGALEHDETKLGHPLHYACLFGASLEVVRYLAKKDPNVLEISNSEHRTPLHLACMSQADADVVIFLTERCPQAASKVDIDGCTPLHLACKVEQPILAVIEDLTEVNAEAGTVIAKDGTWPLWSAVKFGVDVGVIRDLIASNPKAVELKVNDSTLMHRAIETEMPKPIFKDIIKTARDTLETKDAEGRLPLHLAVECKAPFPVIKLLVTGCPNTVDIERDGETPHKMADRLGLDEETVQFLNPFEEQ